MPDVPPLLVLFILLALTFNFANGLNDAANAIATVISTRVLPPLVAIAMGATLNLVGALTGTAVAKTIGSGIIEPTAVTQITIFSALLTANAWVFFATRYGMPVSVSHSLIASLVGAGLGTGGIQALVPGGLNKVLLALAISPIIGFGMAFVAMVLLFWIFRRSTPAMVGNIFGRLQILSAAFMAYSHGKNDGQNAMGVIVMALALYGRWDWDLPIPFWVMFIAAAVMGLGTATGGWRVIRTLGMRITKLQPVHGFAAETSAGLVIEGASFLGLPVSTTHTISSAIMGVGATERLSAVRWGVARNIVTAWVVTYPLCAVVSWFLASLLVAIF